MFLVYFARFGMLYQENSGNPGSISIKFWSELFMYISLVKNIYLTRTTDVWRKGRDLQVLPNTILQNICKSVFWTFGRIGARPSYRDCQYICDQSQWAFNIVRTVISGEPEVIFYTSLSIGVTLNPQG
jgi:hypothetical protein